MPEEMLTVRQVAIFFHVSISTIRRWSDKGLLRCYHLGSRGDRRYRCEDVYRFLEKSTHQLNAYTPLNKQKPDENSCRRSFCSN